MKRRVTWGIVCVGAMIWVLLSPMLVCGPIEAQFKTTYLMCGATSDGKLRCTEVVDSGWSEQQRFWFIAGLMLPGQILLVASFAKFFSSNHVSQACWIPSRRDA